MKLRIDKQNTTKDNMKIPKGYRLLEDWEACKEQRTNKELGKLIVNDWIWVNTSKGIRAAGLLYYDDVFHVGGLNDLDYNGRSRGVFVKVTQ